MPERLHSIYERSWEDVEVHQEPDRSRAVDILRWLTFAYFPLKVHQLADALVISVDSDTVAFTQDDLPTNIDDQFVDCEVKSLCGSFIELQDDDQYSDVGSCTVHLVHASVKEFLIRKLPVPSFIASNPAGSPSAAAHHAHGFEIVQMLGPNIRMEEP